MDTLRLIFADQLSESISSLAKANKKTDWILLVESNEELRQVKHHKKKIVLLLSAMRHFTKQLKEHGFNVEHVKITRKNSEIYLFDEVERVINKQKPKHLVMTRPSDYHLLHSCEKWAKKQNIDVELLEDDRFLCSHQEFESWASQHNTLRMEYFYRQMRKEYDILMDGDKPAGGQWNFDASNRKPPKTGLDIPAAYQSRPDDITKEVIKLVEDTFSDFFGELEPFDFAVTRRQAQYVLKKFIDERLKSFGDYQDAMLQKEPWMFHSHISFYLNCGLLLPLECIHAAEDAYKKRQAPLNAVEGFIRQILGWREYVRGIYWLNMPDYEHKNFFNARRSLPNLYWTGDTKMNCMKQCIKQTQQTAYAHHIQRLMVLGNFALIASLNPNEVNEWYHIVYADAYQWVELPNVTGMILFADGGYLASKPYAASGAYINKMSDYCKGCRYDVKIKNGEKACPFNYLYWNFLARNRSKLKNNQRMRMIYSTYDKMSDERRKAIEKDSEDFLNSLK